MPEKSARTVRFHKFGGTEVLRLEETIVPPPGPDQGSPRYPRDWSEPYRGDDALGPFSGKT